MNPYLETLKDELREELGDMICAADWACFHIGIGEVDSAVKNHAGDWVDMLEAAQECASWAEGTRADLPSIVKYAYAAIEGNLK